MIRNSFIRLYNFFFNYPTPGNLTNVWNFGILAFAFLIVQIISGLAISMYYVPTEEFSFIFTEYLMRDTYFGWYIRYVHSNGASLFFFCVYLHFFRSLFYFSYIDPKLSVWNTGVIVLVLMIIAAFTGYVLPWGQMSFWAATVITNIFSCIPFFGHDIVTTIWGSYGVSTITLNRFYTFHFILPFVILFIIIVHFIYLHSIGSSNNLEIVNKSDKIPFHPYYTIKDLIVLICVFGLYFSIITYVPNHLAHADNYIPADPLVTPEHIVPEWYFLAFYAILRSIPSKLGGIMMLSLSIIILFVFPHYVRSFYTTKEWAAAKYDLSKPFNIMYYMIITKRTCPVLQKYLFWFFVADFIGLSYIGMQPVEEPYLSIGFLLTMGYFAYFSSSLYIHSFQFWLIYVERQERRYEIYLRAKAVYITCKRLLVRFYNYLKDRFGKGKK